jgi:hypothetical protein
MDGVDPMNYAVLSLPLNGMLVQLASPHDEGLYVSYQ